MNIGTGLPFPSLKSPSWRVIFVRGGLDFAYFQQSEFNYSTSQNLVILEQRTELFRVLNLTVYKQRNRYLTCKNFVLAANQIKGKLSKASFWHIREILNIYKTLPEQTKVFLVVFVPRAFM